MNWHKMPPSERYKVLEEEKKKQFAEKVELERTDTLSLRYRFNVFDKEDNQIILSIGLVQTDIG